MILKKDLEERKRTENPDEPAVEECFVDASRNVAVTLGERDVKQDVDAVDKKKRGKGGGNLSNIHDHEILCARGLQLLRQGLSHSQDDVEISSGTYVA